MTLDPAELCKQIIGQEAELRRWAPDYSAILLQTDIFLDLSLTQTGEYLDMEVAEKIFRSPNPPLTAYVLALERLLARALERLAQAP